MSLHKCSRRAALVIRRLSPQDAAPWRPASSWEMLTHTCLHVLSVQGVFNALKCFYKLNFPFCKRLEKSGGKIWKSMAFNMSVRNKNTQTVKKEKTKSALGWVFLLMLWRADSESYSWKFNQDHCKHADNMSMKNILAKYNGCHEQNKAKRTLPL